MYWAKEIVLWQSQVVLWLKFLWMNNLHPHGIMIPVFESLIVKHGAKLQIKIYSLAFFSVENLIKNMKLMAGLLMQKTL